MDYYPDGCEDCEECDGESEKGDNSCQTQSVSPIKVPRISYKIKIQEFIEECGWKILLFTLETDYTGYVKVFGALFIGVLLFCLSFQ